MENYIAYFAGVDRDPDSESEILLSYSLDKHRGKKTLPQTAHRKGQVDNIKQTQQSTDNTDNRNLLQNPF